MVKTPKNSDEDSLLYITYIPSGSKESKVRYLPKGMNYEDFSYIQKHMFADEPEEALEWLLKATDEEINRAMVMGKLSGL